MKRIILTILLCAFSSLFQSGVQAADNGIADRPYMGWSSWSLYSKNINEAKIMAQADAMAKRLKQFGYEYINLDAGWTKSFDEHGRRVFDPQKFPHGIKWLADYVHQKGLKIGLYMEPGVPEEVLKENGLILGTDLHIADITDKTQLGNTLKSGFYKMDFSKPGAVEYVQSSADLLASYGVDFIKFDFVGPSTRSKVDNRQDVKQWYTALQKSRPIWFELSNNLRLTEADDWKQSSNGWRIDGDIEAHTATALTLWSKISRRFKDIPKWSAVAGKGGWNDLDSLEVGNGERTGLTLEERRTAMTLWCISCAPLFLGTDLTHLVDEDMPIITNSEAIAIDQAGIIAKPISQSSPQQVWHAKNTDGSFTVALFNLADDHNTVAVKWSDLGIDGSHATVRDLWTHTDLGDFTDQFSADLDKHACRLLQVRARGQ